jgi:hypothetical protein
MCKVIDLYKQIGDKIRSGVSMMTSTPMKATILYSSKLYTRTYCMQGIARLSSNICGRCLRPRTDVTINGARFARFQSSKALRTEHGSSGRKQDKDGPEPEKEDGAMSRRLAEMASDNLETGGRSARKAVEEAGFSEELKARLQEKIARASFRSDNASAFAQVDMPAGVGRQTRDLAAAQPWLGSESVVDASNRMLQDAHKPLRFKGSGNGAGVRGPVKVNTGRTNSSPKTGVRLANARDKTSFYESMKDQNMSEEDRAKYRQELKDRFSSSARIAPASIQGLTSLANERIEDAIARGQFRNLPRGQKIERDHNASNPFLDTTEYFMNKMIQRQDIVPPWIEKQQEVVATSTRFRGQLRTSWRRHVSRSIASRGGSLENQMAHAKALALAESIHNPQKKKIEKMNTASQEGHGSQMTLAAELKPTPAEDPDFVENEIGILEQILNDDGSLKALEQRLTITTDVPGTASPAEAINTTDEQIQPTLSPFRDPEWEQTERSYHTSAINELNNITRSYNLMAPAIAQKPYFSLERELKACFAEVAPQIADAIRERALAPKVKTAELKGHKPGSVLDKFSTSTAVNVYDETKPQYGFKQFWSDLFTKNKV